MATIRDRTVIAVLALEMIYGGLTGLIPLRA